LPNRVSPGINMDARQKPGKERRKADRVSHSKMRRLTTLCEYNAAENGETDSRINEAA